MDIFNDNFPHPSETDFAKLRSCHPTNKTNFAHLVRLMHRGVVIPFIGAGFSANFGYPGWEKFLREQATIHNIPEAVNALNAREYERAAALLKNELYGSFEFVMLQTFGDHIYKEHNDVHELNMLPMIFRNLMLTTNFDEVIEMLYAKVNGEYIEKLTPKSLHDTKVIYKRIACGDPTLIKLHGDVAAREFVLTEQEYDETYGKGNLDLCLPLPALLRDVLLSKTILFLGCSLEDDRILRVIEQSRVDGSMSFALLPLPKTTRNEENLWKPILTDKAGGEEGEISYAERIDFLHRHNIIPIWYPCDQHDALKIFLRELAGQVSADYRLSVTAAHGKLKHLLSMGKQKTAYEKPEQAYHYYAEAEELLKNSSGIFTHETTFYYLYEVKKFYDSNGYTYERKEILQELLNTAKKMNRYFGIDLAMVYHDMGYTFEKYQYYSLMLLAMKKSRHIWEICQKRLTEYKKSESADLEILEEAQKILNDKKAFIWISLGYASLKNGMEDDAKFYYREAMELNEKAQLSLSSQAFIHNGLSRYYKLLGDTENALKTLDIALEQRRTLLAQEEYVRPQHIINTHSNKIQIYLSEENGAKKAEEEYEACMHEKDIWESLKPFPDARLRILSDHGDILKFQERYEEAVDEYRNALQNRKYLHFVDDVMAAGLYLKMAECLAKVPERMEEALEYAIQAYLIFEKMFGLEHPNTTEAYEYMQSLREKLFYSDEVLKQRLLVQKNFLNYRSDERMEGREEELIAELGLKE